MRAETIVIEERFCGPPESGQGGYCCGLLARARPGVIEVSLRVPPPLGRPLTVEPVNDGQLALRDGETVIAQASPGELELQPPGSVTLDQAEEAVAGYLGFRHHAFPTCFACGPDRE